VHLSFIFFFYGTHLRRIWKFFDVLLIQPSPYLLRCCQLRERSTPPPLSMVGLDLATQTLPRLPLLGYRLKAGDGDILDTDMILVLDRGWGVV
jgi:hypothetical protein